MEKFFYYKTNKCFKDSFDILFDYALINVQTFNKCFIKLIKILNKSISNDKTNESEYDDSLPLDKINANNFKDYIVFFLREKKKKKKMKLNF